MDYTGRRINFSESKTAIIEMFHLRIYVIAFLILATLITSLYIIILPMLPFGAFFLPAIRFITPLQIFFSFAMGILFSLLIVISLRSHAYGLKINKGTGSGAILTSIVNVFCCTPIIPSIVGVLGASSPVIFSYSPPIQHFFAVDYPIFYLLSVLLLTYSILKVASSIGCCRVDISKEKVLPSTRQEV